MAILIPVGTTLKKKREKTKTDHEALQATFSSWKAVDTEALLNTIYAVADEPTPHCEVMTYLVDTDYVVDYLKGQGNIAAILDSLVLQGPCTINCVII